MPNEQDVIDINDPTLQQEMIEADPEADYFELPPPPPDDVEYQVKVLLGEGGMEVRRQQQQDGSRTGPKYLNVDLELRFVDPGQPWDGATTYDRANTIVSRRNDTSKVHTLMRVLGYPLVGRTHSLTDIIRHVQSVLSSEPIATVTGRWEARVKDESASGGWRTVLKGMNNFPLIDPEHPELGHSPWVEDRVRIDPKTRQQVGTGEMVRARYQVSTYIRR